MHNKRIARQDVRIHRFTGNAAEAPSGSACNRREILIDRGAEWARRSRSLVPIDRRAGLCDSPPVTGLDRLSRREELFAICSEAVSKGGLALKRHSKVDVGNVGV